MTLARLAPGEEWFFLPDGLVVVPCRVMELSSSWERAGVCLLLRSGDRVCLSVSMVGWLWRSCLWRPGPGGSFWVVVGGDEVRVWEEGGRFFGKVSP